MLLQKGSRPLVERCLQATVALEPGLTWDSAGMKAGRLLCSCWLSRWGLVALAAATMTCTCTFTRPSKTCPSGARTVMHLRPVGVHVGDGRPHARVGQGLDAHALCILAPRRGQRSLGGSVLQTGGPSQRQMCAHRRWRCCSARAYQGSLSRNCLELAEDQDLGTQGEQLLLREAHAWREGLPSCRLAGCLPSHAGTSKQLRLCARSSGPTAGPDKCQTSTLAYDGRLVGDGCARLKLGL